MIPLLLTLSLLIAVVGAALWASGGKTVHEEQGVGTVEAMPGSLSESSAAPCTALTLFSYDLGYGLGGTRLGAAQASEAVYDRLDRVVEGVAASEADAALLRAVDFASDRTGCIPQLHYVAAALGWEYVATITTWECRYLPWPRSQAGRVRAGQGIISRLPLEHNSWQRLTPARRGFCGPAALFRPHNALQVVDLRCGVRGVRLVQAQLTYPHGNRPKEGQEELVAAVRRVAMPSCVVTGLDPFTANSVCGALGLRPTAGNVLLGSIWSDAKVDLLPPLIGVSEYAPVLLKMGL